MMQQQRNALTAIIYIEEEERRREACANSSLVWLYSQLPTGIDPQTKTIQRWNGTVLVGK